VTAPPFPTETPTETPAGVPTATFTPTPVIVQNCTNVPAYWREHPETWPAASISVGGVTYSQAQLLDILNTPPQGDATYTLIHQLIAARLNIAKGADHSVIAGTIDDVDAWLVAHPLGSDPLNPARVEGVVYAFILESYNNGSLEADRCE
jgi:hypothetical protein